MRTGLLKLQFNKTTDVVFKKKSISAILSATHLLQKGISCIVVNSRSIGLGITCASTSLLKYETGTALYKFTGQVIEIINISSHRLCGVAINKFFIAAPKTGFTKRDCLLTSKTKSGVRDFINYFLPSFFITAFSRSGPYGTTKDRLPFTGPINKLQNSYFAFGFGGNGITFSKINADDHC